MSAQNGRELDAIGARIADLRAEGTADPEQMAALEAKFRQVQRQRGQLDSGEVRTAAVAEMLATVRAYRRWKARDGNADRRPTQEEIAAERGMAERTLAMRLRTRCHVEAWHVAEDIIEAWPED